MPEELVPLKLYLHGVMFSQAFEDEYDRCYDQQHGERKGTRISLKRIG